MSTKFCISNGVRHLFGVLSPYLFTRYIRELIYTVTGSDIGCMIGGNVVNLLAYADDLVLLAPPGKQCRSYYQFLRCRPII